MAVMTMRVVVSFARTPLEEISSKVEEIKALGWEEREDSRGNPWAVAFVKDFPEEEIDEQVAEVRAVMGDYWLDKDAVRELNDAARRSRPCS